jgi:hypothetical protein
MAIFSLPFLVFSELIHFYNLLLLPIFLLVFKKLRDHLFIKRSVLHLLRYLMEPEFAEEYDRINNLNNPTDN